MGLGKRGTRLYERQEDATQQHVIRLLIGRLRQEKKQTQHLLNTANFPVQRRKSIKSIRTVKKSNRKLRKTKKRKLTSTSTPKIKKASILRSLFENKYKMLLEESEDDMLIDELPTLEESTEQQISYSKESSRVFRIPRYDKTLLKKEVISAEELQIIKNVKELNLPPIILQRFYKYGLIYHYHYPEGKRGKYPDPEKLFVKVYNCPSLINERMKVVLHSLSEWKTSDEENNIFTEENENKVPRWRGRIETDINYHRIQVARTLQHAFKDAPELKRTKSSNELTRILAETDFYEWNLQWEKRQFKYHVNGTITSEQLWKIYNCSIPEGAPSVLSFLLSLNYIYIRQRSLLAKGSIMYEVVDVSHAPIILLMEEIATTKPCWKRTKTYRGQDVHGNHILRVVITKSMVPSKSVRLKVYFPPAVFIGCIVQRWTIIQPEYAVKDEKQKVQGIVRMNGTQIPYIGPHSWRNNRTVSYKIDLMNGYSKGLIFGEWKVLTDEPEFLVYFPKEIGLLTKLMLTITSTVVFRDFFGKKLRGREIYNY